MHNVLFIHISIFFYCLLAGGDAHGALTYAEIIIRRTAKKYRNAAINARSVCLPVHACMHDTPCKNLIMYTSMLVY